MTDRQPNVLLIDDQPDLVRRLEANIADAVAVAVHSPDEVTEDDVNNADLVLVDFSLDHWRERSDETLPIAARPQDGLALVAVLRSWVRSAEDAGPTLFALHTGRLDLLMPYLPADVSEHVAARLNNVEWAFARADSSSAGINTDPRLADRIVALARAAADMPAVWSDRQLGDVQVEVDKLLELGSSVGWFEIAEADVRRCHPPLFELAEGSHGAAFLRWILHRILPYPCFLVDDERLALRIGISVDALRDSVRTSAELASAFDEARYQGVLHDFVGPRWWRDGVEAVIFRLTEGDLFSVSALEDGVRRLIQDDQPVLVDPSLVLCLDKDYRVVGRVDRTGAVRIQPDDWPPYAEQAYAKIDDAREIPEIRRLVVKDDEHLLEEGESRDDTESE
jgi:hypothetical protein